MQQLTVSGLLRYVKNLVNNDNNIQNVYVVGEISNYHNHKASGNIYFSLKEGEDFSISCVMFKAAAKSLTFEPYNGAKVLIYAKTSVYEKKGELTLYVFKMNLDGLGELYQKFEELKKKLTAEGKFLDSHKITLKKQYVEKVAVLVGDNSAALSDIENGFARRWPICQVDYYFVLVQGSQAVEDIIKNLKKVDKMGYDAIILSRGGGSYEDLFCFNDENLVNTIYDLDTFIITGVGHEQDFTLVDFVADLRAPTPTASVELITPNLSDVFKVVDDYRYSLRNKMQHLFEMKQMNFDYLTNSLFNYQNRLKNYELTIDNYTDMLKKSLLYKNQLYITKINQSSNIMKNSINLKYKNQLLSFNNDVNRLKHSLLHKNTIYQENIKQIIKNMKYKINLKFNNDSLSLKRYETLLKAYSSENILKRGYSLIFQNNKLIKKSKDLIEKEFEVKFFDGIVKAERK